jgi:ABC-type phosphate transport system substrate-binding protein
MISTKSVFLGGAVAAALFAAAPSAHAATCDTLATNVIYVGGSTAFAPVISSLNNAFINAAAGGTPATLIVYANGATQKGSCTGVGFITADTDPGDANGTCTVAASCVSGVGTGTIDPAGTIVPAPAACDIPANTHLDVALSDVFGTSCAGVSTLPATLKDTFGPVQAMSFVIPRSLPSFQQAITAEEAYFVFGFGGSAGMASPWLDATATLTHQHIRNQGSGTQQMTGRAALIPGDYINQGKMKGTNEGGTSGVISKTSADTDPSAIGILGAADYDLHRDALRQLAFKATGQWFAYYADSTPTSFDKRNVRDGHYWIWGPVHMLAWMNGTNFARPNAKVFLDYISGATTLPPPTTGTAPPITKVLIQSHVIPTCAMHVQRSIEVGPLSKYTDIAPCDCYFEQVATGTTACTSCSLADGTACPGGGVCRRGFCEAN